MIDIPQQLHFLRPEAFYVFIPLLLFIVLYLTSKATSRSWKAVCDNALLPYILTAGGKKSGMLPMLLVFIATSISIVALAGPVWKQLPQPVFREESALVIALDLSQSMHATDIKPSRIERAKLKIHDLISTRKGGQTALIVYAATAFTVTPLTDDDNTIANLVPSLEPGLMPAQGSNMSSALKLASELLQQAGITRGDVLVVTDGISNKALDAIDELSDSGHRLSIMAVGTTEGSPIPLSGGFLTDSSGAIVIPRLEPYPLQQAALKGGGLFVTLQADDSDIERLAELFASKRVKTETEDTELKADIWQEEGPWLLLLVIPLVALWPRRGWLLCTLMFVLPVPQPVHADESGSLWPLDSESLWLRPDQKGMQAFNAGEADQAAELFQDESWKAAAYYRAGEYEKSSTVLDQPANATDFYNKGNVLAKLGNYPDAIKAYDSALSMDPDNEDARFNRELVKQALEQQQSQQEQQQSGDPSEQQQDQSEQQQSQDSSQQQQEQQASAQQQQDDPSAEQEQDKEQKQDQLSDIKENSEQHDGDKQQQQQPEAQQADEEQQPEDEQPLEAQQQDEAYEQEDAETVESEQAMEQWLRRIPDDPGGLMRRKFIYQYRQMPNQAEAQEPW
ncbi:MAG: VWA domain-containing protein [Gammaproteobacteria bacterium]|nr:VWA domain-containing protein [Gammaproteobacteria bacterium]